MGGAKRMLLADWSAEESDGMFPRTQALTARTRMIMYMFGAVAV